MTAKWQYKDAYEAALAAARDLKAENAKLRELVIEQRKLAQMRLAGAISECLWPGETFDQYDALMMATAKVNRLSKELGIEEES